MIKIENDCIGCPDGLPCLGNRYPYRNVEHYYCDICGIEIDEPRRFYNEDLCDDCLLLKEGEKNEE